LEGKCTITRWTKALLLAGQISCCLLDKYHTAICTNTALVSMLKYPTACRTLILLPGKYSEIPATNDCWIIYIYEAVLKDKEKR
jgi:hypothetical protein